jgi:pimeloyl-ACP methyl ester carboxylesterase
MLNVGEPACATRLTLRSCLAQREREAKLGVCDTGRYRCRYVEWGRGPTLVLIPGLASDALSFVLLMARLSPHFHCISYHLPDGIADGARLRTYGHAELAADLFALLDHLQVRECIIAGASFGSTVALTALHQQPARFSYGITLGGFAHRPLTGFEILTSSFVRFLPGRVAHLPLARQVLERNHLATFQEREPELWEFYIERSFGVPLRAFASRLLMVGRLDLRPILSAIRTPVLMVCGDRDPLVGKTCEADLQRGLPNVARVEIEECGHEPHLTHPEVLAEALMQVLMPKFREAGCR